MLKKLSILLLAVGATLSAQPAPRRAANIAALMAYPGFFHMRPIVLVGSLATEPSGQIRLSDQGVSVRVVFQGSAPDGVDEVRAELWDLGRMKADDPRLVNLDLRTTFGVDPDGVWPRPGEATALMATAITPASTPSAPSIRAIVLNRARYLDQRVTVTGQYAGRNLFGDLPDAPARSRWDFVIRSADAAIWVSGARPKGKGFDLQLDARVDTGQWLEVSGVVHEGRGLQWLDAVSEGIALSKPPSQPSPSERETVRLPAAPPPEVVFSTPTEGETDVPSGTAVRIQFSRDVDRASIKDHVRVAYSRTETVERGEAATAAIVFTSQYNAANRVLEIRFPKPLERFRTVKVELLDGLLGTDQQPVKPWTLTFALGGS